MWNLSFGVLLLSFCRRVCSLSCFHSSAHILLTAFMRLWVISHFTVTNLIQFIKSKTDRKLIYLHDTAESPLSPVSTWLEVLTFCVDGGNAFGGTDIPYANGLVSRRRDEQIWVGRVPTELIHAVTMTSVVVFFYLETERTDHQQSRPGTQPKREL